MSHRYWHEQEKIRKEGGLDPLSEIPSKELRFAIAVLLTQYNLRRQGFAQRLLHRLWMVFGPISTPPSGNEIQPMDTVLHWTTGVATAEQFVTTLQIVVDAEPQLLRISFPATPYRPAIGHLPEELNELFERHRFGFQMTKEGEVLRVGSPALVEELLLPALLVLKDTRFDLAEEHFHNALTEYRAKRPRRCIHEAQMSTEATLSALGYKGSRLDALATDFAKRSGERGYISGAVEQLQSLMEALNGLRNDRGGHAPKPGEPEVPDEYALLALHLSASLVVFLASREPTGRPPAGSAVAPT